MNESLLITSNIYIPAITGLFFFIYFVYFAIVFHSKAPSFIYFTAFLLSFSLFLLGRPLQLLLGQHPIQLIIVNIRMFLFCTVSITSMTLASGFFSNQQSTRYRLGVFIVGIAFAATYIIFNTLGTFGSYPVFQLGDTVANDAFTPAATPPFYGREVTIVIQVLIGLSLTGNSLYRLIQGKRGNPWKMYLKNKIFLFNSGILLFAITFTIGSFTKQWWLYYFASIFSALLFGAGVLADIRELYNNYEKLIPIIKEDIIENVAFSKSSRKKLTELLVGLGKSEHLDTFSILLMRNHEFKEDYQLEALESVARVCSKFLDETIGRKNYLVIPLDDRKIGVVLNLGSRDDTPKVHELELFESLQQTIEETGDIQTAIGIGHSSPDLAGLHNSYQEARNALDYAAELTDSAIVHVSNVTDEHKSRLKYPTTEKLRLLAAIKLGNHGECFAALEEFLNAFAPFVERRPDALKVRLYELVGAFIDTTVTAGGDEEELNRLVRGWLGDVERIHAFETAAPWLKEIVERILSFVSGIRKSRASIIIDKAKAILAERYASGLSYRDVAKELYISSSYFQSLFKQETGTTFVEYLTRLRIDRSKELLQTTDKNITEISFDVGYSNPNYFSNTFKKLNGISAKEFRQDSGRIQADT